MDSEYVDRIYEMPELMLNSTHMSYYYPFLPSKAEELINASSANNIPYKPPNSLVEIRDIYEPPTIYPQYPWCIKKKVTSTDLKEGRLALKEEDVFEHVFRYWSFDMANHVAIECGRVKVEIMDHTNKSRTKRYIGDNNIYFEKGPNNTFLLGWAALVRARRIRVGEKVGLYWESGTFHVRILCR